MLKPCEGHTLDINDACELDLTDRPSPDGVEAGAISGVWRKFARVFMFLMCGHYKYKRNEGTLFVYNMLQNNKVR